MTYGEGTRELNLLVPVPMGCFGYVLDRNSVDGRFYARRVTVTGYFVVADGVVEARVLSETGKVLWFKTREVFSVTMGGGVKDSAIRANVWRAAKCL